MVSRRNLVTGALAAGSSSLIGSGIDQTVEAARRGYSGPTLSGNGLRYDLNLSRNEVLTVVRVPSIELTRFSVTIVNRTSLELRVDIFLSDQLMRSVQIGANSPEYLELSQPGNYRFAAGRGDDPAMVNWEGSLPNPA